MGFSGNRFTLKNVKKGEIKNRIQSVKTVGSQEGRCQKQLDNLINKNKAARFLNSWIFAGFGKFPYIPLSCLHIFNNKIRFTTKIKSARSRFTNGRCGDKRVSWKKKRKFRIYLILAKSGLEVRRRCEPTERVAHLPNMYSVENFRDVGTTIRFSIPSVSELLSTMVKVRLLECSRSQS